MHLYNYKNIMKILPDFLLLVLDIIFQTLETKTFVIFWHLNGKNLDVQEYYKNTTKFLCTGTRQNIGIKHSNNTGNSVVYTA